MEGDENKVENEAFFLGCNRLSPDLVVSAVLDGFLSFVLNFQSKFASFFGVPVNLT